MKLRDNHLYRTECARVCLRVCVFGVVQCWPILALLAAPVSIFRLAGQTRRSRTLASYNSELGGFALIIYFKSTVRNELVIHLRFFKTRLSVCYAVGRPNAVNI